MPIAPITPVGDVATRTLALGRWTPLVTTLPMGVALVAGAHYYLWTRLVRDVGLPAPVTDALTALIVVLAASIPVGVVASRLAPTRWSAWWLRPIYLWIGLALFLVLFAAVADVLRLALAPLEGNGLTIARLSAFTVVKMAFGAAALSLREGRVLRVEHVEVALARLPRALEGLRIVQLSDVHIGPTLGRAFLERVVSRVNELTPDLVVITGDLVDGSVADLAPHVAPLADLRARCGTFFVTGNHEYHAGAPEWCEHLETLGVRVLRNEHVDVERDGELLHLAGIDDYESAHFDVGHGADLSRALEGCDPRRPLILLAHQPKAVYEAARRGVDLVLSGHTHGGQLWPIRWLLRMRQPFVAGLGSVGDTRVYVSRGTGHSGPPMRLATPPEITDVVLRCS